MIFSDNVPAVYDLWILGDNFLHESFGSFQSLRYRSQKGEDDIPPYIQEYFNVKEFYHGSSTSGVKFTAVRMINMLIDAIAERKRLPKYLVIVPDKDILYDIDTSSPYAQNTLAELTRWFVRQIDTIIRRKKADFLNKKPGALTGVSTTVIFVRILRRVGSFNEHSKIHSVLQLHAKFNDSLNDAVAKTQHRILTITVCNTNDHFDRSGSLSSKGKAYFWMELDELLEHFQANKVKLLPNPKNPPRSHTHQKQSRNQAGRFNQNNCRTHEECRKLPIPPERHSYNHY